MRSARRVAGQIIVACAEVACGREDRQRCCEGNITFNSFRLHAEQKESDRHYLVITVGW